MGYLLKNYKLFAMFLQNVQYSLFILIYNAVTMFKTICIASFCALKTRYIVHLIAT